MCSLFYLLNSCISSKKIFSIGYAFLSILHLHTLSFRELICYIRAFFGWIVELLSPKNSVHISSCHNFFNSVRCPWVISLEFGLWISYVRFLGLNSWIADLENLGTFFHVPKFKMMYAFRKMFVSCSIAFGVKFSRSDRFFYLLNSCISSMKIFSIGYAFFSILHLVI